MIPPHDTPLIQMYHDSSVANHSPQQQVVRVELEHLNHLGLLGFVHSLAFYYSQGRRYV